MNYEKNESSHTVDGLIAFPIFMDSYPSQRKIASNEHSNKKFSDTVNHVNMDADVNSKKSGINCKSQINNLRMKEHLH